MASSKETRLASLLIDLESELRNLQFWDGESPGPALLQSAEPFCVDTLEFYQWLQWIFIPRIYHALEYGIPLPEKCQITPVGEEWAAKRLLSADSLIAILNEVDSVLSESNQGQ